MMTHMQTKEEFSQDIQNSQSPSPSLSYLVFPELPFIRKTLPIRSCISHSMVFIALRSISLRSPNHHRGFSITRPLFWTL